MVNYPSNGKWFSLTNLFKVAINVIAQIAVSILVVVVKSGNAHFLKAGLRIYVVQFPGLFRAFVGQLRERTFSSIFSVNLTAISPKSSAPCI